MTTVAENLQSHRWDCPDHPNWPSGPYNVNSLKGAADGCKNCMNDFVAYTLHLLGVDVPRKRESGPRLRMSGDTTMAGAIREKRKELGQLIAQAIPRNTGFCLMLFEFEGPTLEYICNAQRPDLIDLLGEFQEVMKKESTP